MRPLSPVIAVTALLVGAACGDGEKKRPIGGTCTSHGQCESGVCGGGLCLDPEGDADGDGLINRVEASLGTDPTSKDSDGDGVDDLAEVGDINAAVDSDGDGLIDAVESSTADADDDCLVDQDDPDNANPNVASAEFPEACGRPTFNGELICPAGNDVLTTGCAKPVADGLFDCFDPGGECTGEVDANVSLQWASGARMDETEGADHTDIALYSSAGTLCGVIRTYDAIEREDDTDFIIGQDLYELRDSTPDDPDDTEFEIRCPGGQTEPNAFRIGLRYSSCVARPILDCVIELSKQVCPETCPSGQVCCDFGIAGELCVPASSCAD